MSESELSLQIHLSEQSVYLSLQSLTGLFFFSSQLLSSIVQQKWQDIVCTCDLQSWKEALAILLTYAKHEDYTQLCGMQCCYLLIRHSLGKAFLDCLP